ncbi:PrgI family protein, partial [Candidatus Woesearchaeota archaeon]|nr:PrgI family protein [Candidatus Woesearchaeota archaeon]
MSYEIPPPLQHKEKIIFSLTFEQLIYVGISLLLSVIILKVITLSIVKWSLISIILVITILFMFFNAKVWIKNFIHFFKFRRADDFSSSMKSFIGISNITDNYIINNKNQKIVLLEV